MNRSLLVIAAIGLVATGALASPEILPLRPVKGVGHLVYDMATGELRPETGGERMGESVWAATQLSGYYFIQRSYGPGATTLDWGDIAGPQRIGGYSLAYASHSVLLPERLDVVNLFFADENGWNSTGRTYLAGFRILNLPGSPVAGRAWIVTVDLDPAGLAFTIDGSDLDGDGLMDFGYTYWFTNYTLNNPQYPHNYLGPLIAGDPNVIPPTAPGIENVFDFFADPNLYVYWGSYWGSGPFIRQFYMELFESELGCPEAGNAGKYCTADVWPNNGDGIWDYADDGDCLVDLTDLSQLLSNYPTASGANHEMGDVWPENGDGIWVDGDDGDGLIDLRDLSELLGQYADNCN